MKRQLSTEYLGADPIIAFLITLIGSIGTVFSIVFVMWLATVVILLIAPHLSLAYLGRGRGPPIPPSSCA